jgi:hypothetical protein
MAGKIALEDAYNARDKDGLRLVDELERIGYLGAEPCVPRPVRAYLELHIEQGPLLEEEGTTDYLPLASGRKIADCLGLDATLVVQMPLLGDVLEVQRIGVGLVRMRRPVADTRTATPRTGWIALPQLRYPRLDLLNSCQRRLRDTLNVGSSVQSHPIGRILATPNDFRALPEFTGQ